jgi:hypothetical protein
VEQQKAEVESTEALRQPAEPGEERADHLRTAQPTNPNNPATTLRPRLSSEKANASATTQKSTDQPAKAPWLWSSEITDSHAVAAVSAMSAPM